MSTRWLPFISNEDFIDVLIKIKNKADESKRKAAQKFSRNTIDPFTALFQMELLSINATEWQSVEENRQIEKSLQNHIGHFHQSLIAKIEGWTNTDGNKVIDVINTERKIIAEVKNKHNTVKGSDLVRVYENLKNLVRKKGQETNGYTAYLVEIIPKKKERYDKPFTASDNTSGQKTQEDELIRRVDGATFYEIVTGDFNALRKVFEAIPLGFSAIGMNIDQEKFNLANDYFTKAIF
jgi:hypothetical protein